MGSIKEVTAANFQAEVFESDVPVVVDFWNDSCGPCMALLPALEEYAAELEGKLKIVKVHADREIQIAQMYRVQSLPTLVSFKNGDYEGKLVGNTPRTELRTFIEKTLR